MSEKDSKEDYSMKDFSPRELGQAIIFLVLEYKDKLVDLVPEAEGHIWLSKMDLLSDEIKKGEEGDVDMIRGLTSELKGLLVKLGCPDDRLEKGNLIQFLEARIATARKEYPLEGGAEEQDPFAEPKKKEYKN